MRAGQRGQVGGVGVDVRDRRAELAQQPDPVEPVDLPRVVAPAAPGVARRRQQPLLLVEAEGALGQAGAPGDVADGQGLVHAGDART